jgi:arylamine N-acetyltransferase
VPYEDISVRCASAPLDEAALTARVLNGRGGYCFELNTARRDPARARVQRQLPPGRSAARPTNHGPGRRPRGRAPIADAGLGEGFIDPPPLRRRHPGRGPFS